MNKTSTCVVVNTTMNMMNNLYCWLSIHKVEFLDTNVVKVVNNDNYICSINLATEFKCWYSKTLKPLQISYNIRNDVVDITIDDQFICVIDIFSSLTCYEIGSDVKFTPTKMHLRSIESTYSHSCAINMGSNLICWNKSVLTNKAVVP